MSFGLVELAIILVIVLLLFGNSRLPNLARSVGQSLKEAREGFFSKGTAYEEKKSQTQEDGNTKPKTLRK